MSQWCRSSLQGSTVQVGLQIRKGVGGTCPARAAARSPALGPLLTALAVSPGALATTASPHLPACTEGHVTAALEQDRRRQPQQRQQAQQAQHAQESQHVQDSQPTQQRPEQVQWQQQQHQLQQLAQHAVQQGNHSVHHGISLHPSAVMSPFGRTTSCLATPSCLHHLSSYAESVPSPASAAVPNSANATIPVPAVKEITEGPCSANIGTAGNADALAGAASVSPDCAADHNAVDAARAAAENTAVVVAADNKGPTDVHQAASSAAAAGQVQAGVQLDDGEHGDEEDEQDAELRKVSDATG